MTDKATRQSSYVSAFKNALKTARREFQSELRPPATLNPLQEHFVEWNAERLGIAIEQSRERMNASVRSFPEGHWGQEFRQFCGLSHIVYLPFASDDESELFRSYDFHSEMHFLRMLSYPAYEPDAQTEGILENFAPGQPVLILDFGCGLAQRSRWLTKALTEKTCTVTLWLADIPTLRKDFLAWLCRREGITMNFLPCTEDAPIPNLPDAIDVCVVTEFFEHVREPITYFDSFNDKMSDGAILVTNVSDHADEYMHVSPDLSALRSRIAEAGLEERVPFTMYQKSGS